MDHVVEARVMLRWLFDPMHRPTELGHFASAAVPFTTLITILQIAKPEAWSLRIAADFCAVALPVFIVGGLIEIEFRAHLRGQPAIQHAAIALYVIGAATTVVGLTMCLFYIASSTVLWFLLSSAVALMFFAYAARKVR